MTLVHTTARSHSSVRTGRICQQATSLKVCPSLYSHVFADRGGLGASAVVFYGRPSAGYHDFSIFLDQKLFSSDASVSGWTLPSTPGFFQAGLDADHEYTLTYRNFADGKNCTYLEDGTRRYCCSMIDGIKLIGSASKLAQCVYTSHYNG